VAVAIAGVTAGALVAIFGDKGTHPATRSACSSLGFLVAIVWIVAIADEVVHVLRVSFLR
jgi:sodium/potassium/calcium exchanger 6